MLLLNSDTNDKSPFHLNINAKRLKKNKVMIGGIGIKSNVKTLIIDK